ncbi:hypothetical protein ACL03H_23240 [Saccharopolyspora sp. MS10]|uniref:hypothetical protein n=1 Tax=Saccharopolyspora sp. MS10 TaxID=3385973 RepID=UPI0039A245B1
MQQLQHAADALGWTGFLVPHVEVLGARFAAVTRVRRDVHLWRREHGWAPEDDPTWFRSWSQPSMHDHLPLAAVEVVGILVPVRKAKYGLRACGTLMTLAPCSVVLPRGHPYRPWPMTELDYYGIGVVADHGEAPSDVLLSPEDRSPEFSSSLFGRWLQEVLYSLVLQRDPELADNPAAP